MDAPSRLPKHWIPAPLPGSPSQSEFQASSLPVPREYSHVRPIAAAGHFVQWVLARWWSEKFSTGNYTEVHRHLDRAAESLGPTWVVASRQFGLREGPLSIAAESRFVQPTPVPVSIEQVRWTIERELRSPFEHTFAAIDPVPVAVHDYSQTHAAHLTWGGEKVWVRVLHPGISQRIARDLRRIYLVLRFFKATRAGKALDIATLTRDLSETLREEADLRYLARDMRLLRKSLFPQGVYIPWVYQPYSTARVCVWEQVDGIPLQQFFDFQAREPETASRWSKFNRVLPAVAGKRLLFAFLEAAAGSGVFVEEIATHQIIMLAEGRVCLAGPYRPLQLDPDFQSRFFNRLNALAEGDLNSLAESTLLLCESGLLSKVDLALVGIRNLYRAWEQTNAIRSVTDQFSPISDVEWKCAEHAETLGFIPGLDWIKVLRAWSMLDQSLQHMLSASGEKKLIKGFLKLGEKRKYMDGDMKPKKSASMRELYSQLVTKYTELQESLVRAEVVDRAE